LRVEVSLGKRANPCEKFRACITKICVQRLLPRWFEKSGQTFGVGMYAALAGALPSGSM
jgi:hypothetical protein